LVELVLNNQENTDGAKKPHFREGYLWTIFWVRL